MFGFLHKKYPDFWNEYKNTFKQKPSSYLNTRFVIFDTETTGLQINNDKILSIGAVAVTNGVIDVNDSFEIFVEQTRFDETTVKIHGIRKKGVAKFSEEAAIKLFLKYIKNAVLVAHHAAFDVQMINVSLHNLGLPKLKNTVLDTGNIYRKSNLKSSEKTHISLDEICKNLQIPLHDRHNAAGDAFITAQVFIKLLKKLKKNNTLSVSFLKRSTKRTDLF